MSNRRTRHFTNALIKSLPLPPPESKSNCEQWSDTEVVGLKILVGRTGNRTYLLRYQSPETRRKSSISIGRWPDLTIKEARDRARRLKVKIADGIDPKIERDNREVVELPDVFTFFHETFLPWAKTSKKSWKDDETRFLRCKPIYRIPMDKLSAHAILKFQSHLATETYKGKLYTVATNNRVLALVKTLCSMSARILNTTNHATKVPLKAENSARMRYLDVNETALLIKVARTYYCKVKGNLIALLWLSGARLRELMCRQWSDVDLTNRTIFIKSTKNGQAHFIHLSPLMLELMLELRALKQPGNPYVFPGSREGTHISPPRKAFQLILKQAGIDPDGLVLHSARHSVATNLLNRGLDITTVQRMLNHADMSSTLHYRKFDKQALQLGSNTLSELVEEATLQLNHKRTGI
ncbi:integrase family protein [Ferrimonas senticii]|uniref:integrase family protein n=1 Tax=Ferrimonas senticii TaxID=394566 RepID=UPI0004240679|nr:integrase family protein [Ferrimonas senticii]